MIARGYGFLAHSVEQSIDAVLCCFNSSIQGSVFLLLVLLNRAGVEGVFAVFEEGIIIHKKLWAVKIHAFGVRLLVKVHGAHCDLRIFEIRGDVEHIIVGAHIA